MPDDFRVSITDAAAEGSLPGGELHLVSLLDFLQWMLRDGQRMANLSAMLHYLRPWCAK